MNRALVLEAVVECLPYNTMQTFLGVVGMEPLHMVSPASQDQKRIKNYPIELVAYLEKLIKNNITPRDIVNRDSIRNAIIVAMSVGGSTNVMLHAPEIARVQRVIKIFIQIS